MTARQKIQKALEQIMPPAETRACNIFKGYDFSTGYNGWHFARFGHTATYLGRNLQNALDMIEQIAEERNDQL